MERPTNRTVMIVDRSEIVRQALKEALTGTGFKVISETDSLDSAMETYRILQPEIVALDITVSSDCIDFLKIFKEVFPGAKVVMISTLGQHKMISESIRAGAMDFLLKPFSRNSIAQTMRRLNNN